jgi:Protein of unknown function with HXXEE motif
MERPLQRKTVLWMVPFLFLLHNGEEALTMASTLEEVRSGMPRFLRVFLPPVTEEQFLVSLVLLSVLIFLCAWFGNIGRDRSWGVYALVGLQMVLLLNVLAHVTTLAVVGRYTAGSVTSLLVNLPFSVYLIRRAFVEGWVARHSLLVMIPLAFVIHTPILFGFLYFSGFVARLLFGT